MICQIGKKKPERDDEVQAANRLECEAQRGFKQGESVNVKDRNQWLNPRRLE